MAMPTKKSLSWFAPAKINWWLEVLGKRPDGYHELITFMSQISIWDGLVFEEADPGQVLLDIDDPTLDAGDSNLVTRAVKALWGVMGATPGVRIRLYKRIPREAGLGGGSSDAAATLAGLNRFWNLGYSREQLVELASTLGSDVPFFLGGPSAICRGRGERCEDRPGSGPFWLVLIQPDFGLATRDVYQSLRLDGSTRQVDRFLQAWGQGHKESLAAALFNRLEQPALGLDPRVGSWKQKLDQVGAMASAMTGSGSVIFGLFATARQACDAANRLSGEFPPGSPWMAGGGGGLRSIKVAHTLVA